MPCLFILFVFFSSLSQMIDILARISNFKGKYYGYYGLSELEVAKWIQENTSPNARFLTSNNPNQFIPMLTGMPIYIGYTGRLWSQGKGYLMHLRQDIVRSYLATGDPSLICRDGIKYILWDKNILETCPKANRESVLLRANIVLGKKMGD